MAFIDIINQYQNFDFKNYLQGIDDYHVEKSLYKEKKTDRDFLNLLSDAAVPYMEEMAGEARKLTLNNFGRAIQLYVPLYIANYCSNECAYCGFSRKNRIGRSVLSPEEIEQNAVEIVKTGMKHILLLTGEAPELTPLSYLVDAVKILRRYFASVSIEIFPMETDDYQTLKAAGVDGLTVYQEVYDRQIYDQVHLSGKKKDYIYRLDTPERGAAAGFRAINIGTLFGLGDPLMEAFFAGLHAEYLQNKYPEAEISLSLPRLNEAEGSFQAIHPLSDKKFVQFILAYRLFLPRAGIAISTRERADFRDHLVPLGITKMSAGSVTSVGGYTAGGTPQFEVSDNRNAADIAKMIEAQGYEPVYKDWDLAL